MATAHDFFTPEAVASTSGAIAAVTAVSVTVRQLVGWESPKGPFIVSLLVVYGAAGNAHALAYVPFREYPAAIFWHPLVRWLLPIPNACLLFTAVLGVTGAAHAVERERRSRPRYLRIMLPNRVKKLNFEFDPAIGQRDGSAS
jgi:hypothetical protein